MPHKLNKVRGSQFSMIYVKFPKIMQMVKDELKFRLIELDNFFYFADEAF